MSRSARPGKSARGREKEERAYYALSLHQSGMLSRDSAFEIIYMQDLDHLSCIRVARRATRDVVLCAVGLVILLILLILDVKFSPPEIGLPWVLFVAVDSIMVGCVAYHLVASLRKRSACLRAARDALAYHVMET